jgi:dTDP-4-amino-4,6-dideoxygalactose transaminase
VALPVSDAAVPLLDLTRQASALEPELAEAAARVLSSGTYVLGPEVEMLEDELARMVGVANAVGVASGTDALHLALRAAGIGRGDLVLTSPFTFFATISAILAAGAEPVFADICADTFAIDPDSAAAVVEGRSAAAERAGARPDRIAAVVPVHLYGHPAPMDALAALTGGLPVVEDAAQALGAGWHDRKAGALGLAGCFSFFPSKNLGGYGDGGLVTTDDDGLADRLRLLRAHGARPRYTHLVVGTNSRLDALQAALLRVKLPHLDRWLAARRAHAAAYDRELAGLEDLVLPVEAHGAQHGWHQYTVRVTGGRRHALRLFLADRGIATAVYYPAPAHLQPALASSGYRRGDFPVAEEASRQVLSLPLFPELRDDERDRVVTAVREGLSECADRNPQD